MDPGDMDARSLARRQTQPQAGARAPMELQWLGVLRGDPENVEALHGLGLAALRRNQPGAAVELLTRAAESQPQSGPVQLDLGIALCRCGQIERGLDRLDRAVALMPRDAAALANRANALCLLARHEAALACCDRAIALDAACAAAHGNRGNALEHLGRHEEAIESLDRALALNPDFADAHFNRGVATGRLGRIDEARRSYLRALAINPRMARARWNLGVCELQLGDYENGLPHYEYRLSRSIAAARERYPQPAWAGAGPLDGRTLYVYPEGYLGDMIQFCRYLPMLEAQGAHVLLSAPRVLHALLRGLSSTVALIDGPADPGAFDRHIALMSLPHAFRTTLTSIPATDGYLRAEPGRIARWTSRIGTHGLRVGVAWQGNRNHGDNDRFFPPSALAPLAGVPGVRLISLQKPEPAVSDAIAASGLPIETLGDDLDAGGEAFMDTAAAMHGLDLVVACDSAVAHLAGALGRRCWLALKKVPDWRWMIEGDRAPWYRDIRLFRQERPGNWPDVFAGMAEALASFADERN